MQYPFEIGSVLRSARFEPALKNSRAVKRLEVSRYLPHNIGVYATLLMPMPVIGMDRAHLKVHKEHAPAGHAVSGPHRHGEIWRCSCPAQWSIGTHPEPISARPDDPKAGERQLPYPLGS